MLLSKPDNLTERGDTAALWAVRCEYELRERAYQLHRVGAFAVASLGVTAALRRFAQIMGGTR